jgi:hypothetical protein
VTWELFEAASSNVFHLFNSSNGDVLTFTGLDAAFLGKITASNTITESTASGTAPLIQLQQTGQVTWEWFETASSSVMHFYSSSVGDVLTFSGTSATLFGALAMGAHKITGLSNGSANDDAAAFGQIASGINAAVSGTSNTIAKFTGTNTVGNGSETDDGTNFKLGATQLALGHSGAVSFTGLGNNGVMNYNTSSGVMTVAANSTGGTTEIDLATSSSGAATTQLAITSTTSTFSGALQVNGTTSVAGALSVTSGAKFVYTGLVEDNGTQYTVASCGTGTAQRLAGGALTGTTQIGPTGTGCVITTGVTAPHNLTCWVSERGATKGASYTTGNNSLSISNVSAGAILDWGCQTTP